MSPHPFRYALVALALAGGPVHASPPGEALWSLDAGG